MSLVFITGAPGSGKTAVSGELLERGFTVHDTDDPNRTGMAGWHDLSTSRYVAGFNELNVTDELLKTHVWRLTDEALDGFRTAAETDLIYLCGRLRDARKVIEASSHIVFLAVSSETIEDRLARRSQIPGEVEWGRESWQIARSIEVNRTIEAEYRLLGAIMVNAEQPLNLVVNDIVAATVD